jgi:hypothetical protein
MEARDVLGCLQVLLEMNRLAHAMRKEAAGGWVLLAGGIQAGSPLQNHPWRTESVARQLL